VIYRARTRTFTPRLPKEPKALKPLLEAALAAVHRSEHTAAQLRRKLVTKGYLLREVNNLITEFEAKNYINDTRAAKLLVRRRAEDSKWGAGKIKQELALKGVAKELAQTTILQAEEAGHDWLATATRLLRFKYKKPLPPALPTSRAERQKELARRLGFLQRRGFSGSQAAAALKAANSVEVLEEGIEE
jgi:regulatory protein